MKRDKLASVEDLEHYPPDHAITCLSTSAWISLNQSILQSAMNTATRVPTYLATAKSTGGTTNQKEILVTILDVFETSPSGILVEDRTLNVSVSLRARTVVSH